MKKFYKSISLILAVIMVFSFCACGSSNSSSGTSGSSGSSTSSSTTSSTSSSSSASSAAPSTESSSGSEAPAAADSNALALDDLLAAAAAIGAEAGNPTIAKEQFDVYMEKYGDLEEVANAAAGSPAAEITFSHSVPASGYDGLNFGYLAGLIQLFSGNSIEVKVFPSATLVDDNGALDAIMSGNVDFAKFQIANITPTMPEMIPFEIPGAFPADDYWGWTSAVEPIVNEIFLKYGVKYIGPDCMDTQNYVGLKKCYTGPEDFKGEKIRVAGKWYADAVELWGGAPVTIGIGDLASALERKTVDGVYTTWRATEIWKLYESAKYLTYTTQQENLVGIMMNLEKWDSLTEAQQKAIESAYLCYRYYVQTALAEQKVNFQKQFVEEFGGTVYILNDEENALFVDACAPLVDEAKTRCGDLGNQLFEVFEELRK